MGRTVIMSRSPSSVPALWAATGPVSSALPASPIQADAGQKNRHAGRSLYNKGLHREDNAFLTAPGLELAVVHTVGEEKCCQYAEHAVAGKHHHARHAEQCQTAGKARQAEQEQHSIAAQRQPQTYRKYGSVAELFAQHRIENHHAEDLCRTADG